MWRISQICENFLAAFCIHNPRNKKEPVLIRDITLLLKKSIYVVLLKRLKGKELPLEGMNGLKPSPCENYTSLYTLYFHFYVKC